MKFVLIAAVYLVWTLALPITAQAQEQEFALKLTPSEINLIAGGLQQTGPFSAVAALLNKLQAQVNAQVAPPTNPVAAPPITPPKK